MVVQTIKRDSEWLKAQGLMDYSSLLGIEEINLNPNLEVEESLRLKV